MAYKQDWIKSAIKRPGQLHKDLGLPEDEDIPRGPGSKFQKALAGDYGKKVKERAELAKTLKKFKQ